MLVVANRDIIDGGSQKVVKGATYLVVATRKQSVQSPNLIYYIFPFDRAFKLTNNSEPNPLGFNAEYFELVSDKLTNKWTVQNEKINGIDYEVCSFNEWFIDGFGARVSDVDMNEDDYPKMITLLSSYAKLYEKFEHKHS